MDQSIQFQDIYLQSPRLYSTDEGIDQWNSIEIPEMHPHKYTQLIFDRSAKQFSEGKIAVQQGPKGATPACGDTEIYITFHVPVITLFQQKHTSLYPQPPQMPSQLWALPCFCSFLQTGLTMLSQLISIFYFSLPVYYSLSVFCSI